MEQQWCNSLGTHGQITHTFLEGILQRSNDHVFLLDLLFLHELGVAGANAAATQMHGGLGFSDAFHHLLQLLLDAVMQVVGGDYCCIWATVAIKQGPVITSQILVGEEE